MAFAGDVYCESRNENMDDHWRVLHALPGDGSSGRPALGDVMISVPGAFQHAVELANGNVRVRRAARTPISEVDALQELKRQNPARIILRARSQASRLRQGFFQPGAGGARLTLRGAPQI